MGFMEGLIDFFVGTGKFDSMIKQGWESISEDEAKIKIPKKIRSQVGKIREKHRFNMPLEIKLEDNKYFYSFSNWVNYGQAEEELQPTRVYRKKKKKT
jgi:hypothetical protein